VNDDMLRHWQGMALPELIIVLGLGSGATLALTSLVAGSVSLNQHLLNNARLTEELGNVFALIQSDLQRAGYDGNTQQTLQHGASVSVFSHHLSFGAYLSEPANTCVTFRYDVNSNGVLDTQFPNEQFGYRLQNKTVEVRKAGASCHSKGWEDISDRDLVIVTELSFQPSTLNQNGVPVTRVAIRLSGYLKANPGLSQTYSKTVLLKNHVG
jgi:prepilin peptidase dependent protein B